MAKAKKLPSGSWRCLVYSHMETVVRPDGTTKEKRIYKSFTCDEPGPKGKRMCEQMAANWAMQKEEKNNHTKFKNALDDYISLKTPVLSPSTIRGYRNIQKIMNSEFEWFCKKSIAEIQQEDVQIIINYLSKSKKPKTVRNYHGLISAVIGSDLRLNTTLPQKVQPDYYLPSESDIQRLMCAVDGTELEVPVLLAAFCLMRRGEICGLSMNDIKENIIHVHHSLVEGEDKNLHLKAPKTNSSDRYVEAPDFVIDRIKQVGHITTLKPHSITIMFERVLKKNNIQHFRFHDLRHYSASIRHALGIPDAYIMKDGGWKTDGVLKSVYRHAMDDKRKEMADMANNYFAERYMQHEMQHEKENML